MTGPAAIPTLPVAEPPFAVAQPRFIELTISGEELVLTGRFDHWVPMSLETGGKENEAQILFDVTSTGMAADGGETFSFVSNEVKPLGEGAYSLKGIMRRGEVERRIEGLAQVPAAHSPFAVLTFRMDERTFPEVWTELEARVAMQGPSSSEVRPRAWVVTPTLGVA